MLRHVAHAGAPTNRHFAGVGFDTSFEDLEQRRFARAIRSDESDAGAVFNNERNVLKERGNTVSFRQALYVDNRRNKTVTSGYLDFCSRASISEGSFGKFERIR